MRKWLFLLFFALILGAGAWYFWSLGSLPEREGQHVSLAIDNQGVEVQRSGSDSWQNATNGDVLNAGDSVRTGSGAATLTFFDLSQARLAPQSTVRINEVSLADGQPFTVKLELENGRIWSRILRLFELDDTFTVTADSVVATVRGTAFELAHSTTGTAITVFESAVEVGGLVVSEGFTVSFDSSGKLLGTQATGEDLKQDDWVSGNLKRDLVFANASQERLLAHLGDLDAAKPDSVLDGLTRMSERLHLSLAAEKAPELYVTYAERRLAAIKRLIERGKSGAAFNALTSVENEVAEKLNGPEAEKYRSPMRRALFEASTLLSQVSPSSPLYRMKQKLEDMQVSLAGDDGLEVAYARMRAIDARLDETLMLIDQSSLDEAASALDAARQGLVNVERDVDHLPEGSPSDRLTALRGKLNVLKAREAAYRVRLATAIEPPQSQLTVPSDGAASSTSSTETGFEAATGTPSVQETESYETISLSALPGQPKVGDSVRLKVRAIKADGSQVDVTSQSTFDVTGPAEASGSVLTPNGIGKINITAVFLTEKDRFEARLALDVTEAAPIVLQSLKLTTTAPVSLVFGATAVFTATAIYSDGSTKDVTASVSFSASNLRLGFMDKNVFNAGQDTAGQVQVVGTYKEGDKTVTAFHDFNIVAP
ncbi:FecR domain-containing protein [Candidatus Uhrbacteria bacterium]|nr:FecR domain-containing protein [Candidatus Uhrbacteria bacterium]